MGKVHHGLLSNEYNINLKPNPNKTNVIECKWPIFFKIFPVKRQLLLLNSFYIHDSNFSITSIQKPEMKKKGISPPKHCIPLTNPWSVFIIFDSLQFSS